MLPSKSGKLMIFVFRKGEDPFHLERTICKATLSAPDPNLPAFSALWLKESEPGVFVLINVVCNACFETH